ncbi:MAG: MCP four helix bundle domain-containing protein [Deltaproteobacteria bacterium]|nr:MCP four helix bundle domain-containing protein [Deltaproteobacteria bacterium]
MSLSRTTINQILLMAAGALIFGLILLVVGRFNQGDDIERELAARAGRLQITAQMRLDLASASEAEKSAVLASTDQDSLKFANQARTAAAAVENERKELGALLEVSNLPLEKNIFAQFSQAFVEFQRVDADLLELAVKNTNIKAYNLTFGPAARAIRDFDQALSRLAKINAESSQTSEATFLALSAQANALRIQALLPPHIAEASDQKMDELEAEMSGKEKEITADLDVLSKLAQIKGSDELDRAKSAYAVFQELKARVIALSRENSNVRSLSLSLDKKRKVMIACQEALEALQKLIQEEPLKGVTYTPIKPR